MKLLARAFAAIWTAWMCADLINSHQVGAKLLAVPVAAAILALIPWPRAIRVGTQVSGVFVLTLFVIATGATIGILFLPSAFAARAATSPRRAASADEPSPVSPALYTADQRAG